MQTHMATQAAMIIIDRVNKVPSTKDRTEEDRNEKKISSK